MHSAYNILRGIQEKLAVTNKPLFLLDITLDQYVMNQYPSFLIETKITEIRSSQGTYDKSLKVKVWSYDIATLEFDDAINKAESLHNELIGLLEDGISPTFGDLCAEYNLTGELPGMILKDNILVVCREYTFIYIEDRKINLNYL